MRVRASSQLQAVETSERRVITERGGNQRSGDMATRGAADERPEANEQLPVRTWVAKQASSVSTPTTSPEPCSTPTSRVSICAGKWCQMALYSSSGMAGHGGSLTFVRCESRPCANGTELHKIDVRNLDGIDRPTWYR